MTASGAAAPAKAANCATSVRAARSSARPSTGPAPPSEKPITPQVLHGQGAWLRSSRMPTLDERGDHEGGLIALVRETASGFGQLVADHIRLARLEMTADAKAYVRDGGVLLVGAVHPGDRLRNGVHRRGPGAVARDRRADGVRGPGGPHVDIVGAIALGMILRRMKRVQLMQGTKEEVSRSISVVCPRGRTDMAVHHEKEFGVSDTEVDTDLEPEDHEGKTHPFTEVDRAEAAVERSRERVERSMVALRDAIARRTDWRGWMAQRPAVFLGAAVFLGFLWGYRQAGAGVRTGGERW